MQSARAKPLGLVGESGCGKTTVGRTLLQLYKPTGGRILFDGKVIYDSGEQYDENGKLKVDANGKPVLGKKVQVDMLPYRKQMQMVFQDPYSSLNPRMTVEDIIGEPLDVHKLCKSKKERHERVIELMELVGLNAEHAMRYPHEFSGGQRQRIGIARALAVNPKFIVCDEPVSALDVSIQAQVVNMFEDLQEKLGVAYLFIAHDLLVVHHISDRIAVMYLGKMMELADSDELNDNPIHPYTQSLLSAVPIPDPKTARQAPADRAGGGCAQPAAYAQRLPLPHTLPLCDRTVRQGNAPVYRPRQRPLRCLLEQVSVCGQPSPLCPSGGKVSQNLHNCVPISRAKFGTKPKKG